RFQPIWKLSWSTMQALTTHGKQFWSCTDRIAGSKGLTLPATSASIMPLQPDSIMHPVIGLSSWTVTFRTARRKSRHYMRKPGKDMRSCLQTELNVRIIGSNVIHPECFTVYTITLPEKHPITR